MDGERSGIGGVLPAILTPFTKGGAGVDHEKAGELLERLIGQGVQGVYSAGTTGEGLLMTVEERKRLLETLVGAARGRVRVVAHVGALTTAATVELARHARDAGADAAGVLTPPFYGYDESALTRHFTEVAKAVAPFPILLYNLPSHTANALTAPFVVELARRIPNLAGIKDSSGDMGHLSRLLAERPDGFAVINGTDEYTFQALVSGAAGSVSSTANVFPEVFREIARFTSEGRLDQALAAQARLNRLCNLFRYGNMVAYYKEGLRARGFDPGAVRPPQRELTQGEKHRFHEELASSGLA